MSKKEIGTRCSNLYQTSSVKDRANRAEPRAAISQLCCVEDMSSYHVLPHMCHLHVLHFQPVCTTSQFYCTAQALGPTKNEGTGSGPASRPQLLGVNNTNTPPPGPRSSHGSNKGGKTITGAKRCVSSKSS